MNIRKRLKKDLIGQHITIKYNDTNKVISGTVIDETRETLTLENKKIIKNQVHIIIENHEIDGKILRSRPEERTKMRIK